MKVVNQNRKESLIYSKNKSPLYCKTRRLDKNLRENQKKNQSKSIKVNKKIEKMLKFHIH